MALLETPHVQTGWHAAPFNLKGTDGTFYTLDDVKGAKGLLVMFICNHCPYVKAVIDRIVRDVNELKNGIALLLSCPMIQVLIRKILLKI